MAEEGLEDKESKTEEPSQRKLDKAVEEGNVINSKEVNNFFILCVLTLSVMWLLPMAFKYLVVDMRNLVANLYQINSGFYVFKIMASKAILYLSPILGILVLTALMSNFIQSGKFVISTKKLELDLSKLSIIKGLNRMFSIKNFVEFLKSLAKIILVGICLYFIIRMDLKIFPFYPDLAVGAVLGLLHKVVIHLVSAATLVVAVLAGLDYVYQRFDYFKGMRMSKYELKKENKEAEGNPEIKQKQKSLIMEILQNTINTNVPKSTVIITNPTHFAVALQYDEKTMDAPILVAKGLDILAEKIKDLAKDNKVPIIENPPLARNLYKKVKINKAIPEEYYKAVAKILSYVYSLEQEKAQGR